MIKLLKGYRFLKEGEIILAGDLFNSHGGGIWKPVEELGKDPFCSIGLKLPGGRVKFCRRGVTDGGNYLPEEDL